MLADYQRLFPYLRRYRARYVLGAALVVTAVTLRLLVPWLLGSGFDALRALSDSATETGEDAAAIRRQLGWLALAMIAAAGIGAFVRTGSRLMILGNSRKAAHDLRSDLFAHLQRLPPSFYSRHQTGQIMSRCVNDMQNVQGLLGPVFMYLVETGVLYAVGLAFLVSADPASGLIGLLPFPLFLIFARRIATRIQVKSREGQDQLGKVSAKVDESLSGHKVIKSLALEGHDRTRFEGESERYRDLMLELVGYRATLQPMMVFLTALSTALVLVVGGPRVAAGDITIGDLIRVVSYVGLLAAPTGILGFVISSLKRGAAALQRMNELFVMPVSLQEVAEPRRGVIDRGGINVRGLNVTFPALADQPHLDGCLPDDPEQLDRARQVLTDVSFSLPAGQTLGVVGPTGAGKSVLLRALARQLEIDPGQVFVDGTDITEIAFDELRRSIGMVPQDTFLFSASLADNVALGRPDASRAEVAAAVATAQLEGDLDQLPNGLETMLGERGVNLSGGQRQRTALARVVLLEPKVLLLDDTLSAIDADTADAILEGIRPMMAGRTTVIVAHRVATLRHADQIVVLDEGRIVARGSHAELVQQGGFYAELFERQSRE